MMLVMVGLVSCKCVDNLRWVCGFVCCRIFSVVLELCVVMFVGLMFGVFLCEVLMLCFWCVSLSLFVEIIEIYLL